MTQDEKFLIQLYRVVSESGDLFRAIDPLVIAKKLGQKEAMAKNIVKHLAQANFIKKVDDTKICLTEQGRLFALEEMHH